MPDQASDELSDATEPDSDSRRTGEEVSRAIRVTTSSVTERQFVPGSGDSSKKRTTAWPRKAGPIPSSARWSEKGGRDRLARRRDAHPRAAVFTAADKEARIPHRRRTRPPARRLQRRPAEDNNGTRTAGDGGDSDAGAPGGRTRRRNPRRAPPPSMSHHGRLLLPPPRFSSALLNSPSSTSFLSHTLPFTKNAFDFT